MNDLAVATSLATSPFSAFAELRERPRFWFPLLVVVLSSVGIVVWYYGVVDIDWMKDCASSCAIVMLLASTSSGWCAADAV